jgi:triosephosphate isomerase
MRSPLVAGNWKMNLTNPEAVALVRELLAVPVTGRGCEVVVCPAFTALAEVALVLSGTAIRLGGQNLYWEPSGAFTGEVSAAQLRSVSCSYVIVGHSERRWVFGEDDAGVGRRTRAALEGGLIPIVCVGETLQDRETGATEQVVRTQLGAVLDALGAAPSMPLVVAYEPVWAIGTGKTATPEQAQEVHAFIRPLLVDRWGEAGAKTRILYGGSVNADNATALMSQPDVDGALVGGASLKAPSFDAIVAAAGATGPAR